MHYAQARLYLDAAENDPFVAAWVSVLDQHQMHYRVEVAPQDWESAFEELFNFGFIADEEFNAIDFKRAFRRRTPPVHCVEAALCRLARFRQEAAGHKELDMSTFDRPKPSGRFFDKPDSLTLPNAERQRLGLFDNEPAFADNKGEFGTLAPRLPPDELIARPVRFAGVPTHEIESHALDPLVATRNALTRRAPQGADLPCHTIDDDDESLPNPRPYIEQIAMRLHCCGSELQLKYEDGRNVSHEFPKTQKMMLEFYWRAVCPHCQSEHHHTITRPYPADYNPR